MAKGRIAKKVAYYVKRPHNGEDINGNTITVIETYPFNPDSKGNVRHNAREWAMRGWTEKGTFEPPCLEFDNKPFSVKIIKLEIRTQGGRAYKVLDDQGRLFDLREDQLMEVIQHTGIDSGGQVRGTFVWGSVSSQFKLILVEGDTYKNLEKPDAPKLAIKPSKLELGGVYRCRDDSYVGYLGRVKLPGEKKWMYALAPIGCKWKGGWSWSRFFTPQDEFQDGDWDARWDETLLQEDPIQAHIKILTSPRVEEHVGTVSVKRIRDNFFGCYDYRDGHDGRLVERHSGAFPCEPHGRYSYNQSEKLEWMRLQRLYVKKVRDRVKEFRDLLEWK